MLALAVACAGSETAPLELAVGDAPAVESVTIVGFSTEGFGTTAPVRHVSIRVTQGEHTSVTEVDLPTQKTEVSVLGSGYARVQIEGYAASEKAPGELRWVQRAGVTLKQKPGEKRLLRMNFDPLCMSDRGDNVVSCKEDETCARGLCIGMDRSSLELEPYMPDWFLPPPDACRPKGDASAPEVLIGMGTASFEALADGAVQALEAGPQGGHHFWIAAKGRSFAERGTLVAISGRNPETGVEAASATSLFSLTPLGDGSCSVSGIRYQVDAGGIDHRAFRGGPFDLTIEMRDRFGSIARATKRIRVSN
jgi:hypothetical protein